MVHAQTDGPIPSSVETGRVYYLYNPSKKGFLVGGNQYGTQASIARDHAYKVRLEKWVDDEGKWDGESYYLKDSVETGDYKNAFRNVFIENNGKVFVDQNDLSPITYPYHSTEERDCRWVVKPKAAHATTYIIQPSVNNKTFNSPNLYLSAKNMSSNILPVVGVFEDCTNNEEEWCFITLRNAERFIEHRIHERQHKKQEIMRRLYASFLSQDIPVGDTVYLFNPVFEKFLIGENTDKSQASLASDASYKAIIHKYFDKQSKWDGSTYYITDSVEAGNYAGAFRNLFIETNGWIYVDQAAKTKQNDFLWEIIPSKTRKGAYNIRPSVQNKIFSTTNLPDRWLGSVDFHPQDFPVVSLVQGCNDSTATDWYFLSREQRDKVFEARNRQLLQELIFDVSDAFPLYDITAAQQTCDNPSCTVIGLDTAIGKLRHMLLSGGSPEKKEASFTQLLINPDFAWPRGRGWNAAYDVQLGSINWWGGDASNPCAEAWQSEYDFYQVIRGVPTGLYRIDLQAFSRPRGDDLSWIERDTSFVTPVIYANEMEMPVDNLMHTTFPNLEEYDFLKGNYMGNDAAWQMMDGSYVLHNQQAASLAFSKGYFDQSVYCYVHEGVIKAGIKDNHRRTGAWTAWDNLRITCIPETQENYATAIKCHLKKAKELERLAGLKAVDTRRLSQTISEAESALAMSDINVQREKLIQLNQEILQIRNGLALQEFGTLEDKVIYSYSQISSETDTDEDRQRREKQNSKRDSINHTQNEADSYFFMGIMVADQDKNLAQKHFQEAFDTFVGLPTSNTIENLDACAGILSSLYVEKGQYDDAMEVWKRLIGWLELSKYADTRKKVAMAYCELGNLFNFQKKDYQAAEEEYRKGVKIAEAVYEEAIHSSYEFIRKDAQKLLSATCNDLAYALAYRKNYDEALEVIDRAIEIQYEEANYYDSKGEILLMKGDEAGAVEMWKKVMALDPDFLSTNQSDLYKQLKERGLIE